MPDEDSKPRNETLLMLPELKITVLSSPEKDFAVSVMGYTDVNNIPPARDPGGNVITTLL